MKYPDLQGAAVFFHIPFHKAYTLRGFRPGRQLEGRSRTGATRKQPKQKDNPRVWFSFVFLITIDQYHPMNQFSSRSNGRVNGAAQPVSEADEDLGKLLQATSVDTPLTPSAFELTDEEKIEQIAIHFEEIMEILGLDLRDDSLQGTPRRVAKMYVQEIFRGLKPDNKPKVSLFENKFAYKNMLVERNITVKSFCEHHFLPILGKAHVAYIPNGNVIGLSKINRIVDYYARRPQVQERLTKQIGDELRNTLQTQDVAVFVDARHMCVEARGIEHDHSSTVTTEYSGRFLNEHIRQEFLQAIRG